MQFPPTHLSLSTFVSKAGCAGGVLRLTLSHRGEDRRDEKKDS